MKLGIEKTEGVVSSSCFLEYSRKAKGSETVGECLRQEASQEAVQVGDELLWTWEAEVLAIGCMSL